jgi:hypothetical protein
LLAVVLTVLGGVAAGSALMGVGVDRFGGQLAAANAVVVEPVIGFLVSTLEMIAPFDLPGWVKDLYAVLVVIVLGGLLLSAVLGLLLLPVFYALYRSR